MQCQIVDPFHAVGTLPNEEIEYRVRAWNEPLEAGSAWRVDEWDITDADSVVSVIEWADGLGAHSVEVFVRYEDHALDAGDNWVTVDRHARVYGVPADDGGTTEIVTFTRR